MKVKNSANRPGQILLREHLEPRGISIAQFAAMLTGIDKTWNETRLRDLIAGRRKFTTTNVSAISLALVTQPSYWLQLQTDYENGLPHVANTQRKASTTSYQSDADKERDAPLRNEALKLVDSGLSSDQVGDRLGVKKMAVAGWRAARTRGSYDDED